MARYRRPLSSAGRDGVVARRRANEWWASRVAAERSGAKLLTRYGKGLRGQRHKRERGGKERMIDNDIMEKAREGRGGERR